MSSAEKPPSPPPTVTRLDAGPPARSPERRQLGSLTSCLAASAGARHCSALTHTQQGLILTLEGEPTQNSRSLLDKHLQNGKGKSSCPNGTSDPNPHWATHQSLQGKPKTKQVFSLHCAALCLLPVSSVRAAPADGPATQQIVFAAQVVKTCDINIHTNMFRRPPSAVRLPGSGFESLALC